ncbi:MAG: hypothetical protein ACE5GS_11135 [Kiloniellaceae bacterium]
MRRTLPRAGVGAMTGERVDAFLKSPLRIINVGLGGFARELEALEVPVVQVDWSPPAGGDPKLADLLSKLGS